MKPAVLKTRPDTYRGNRRTVITIAGDDLDTDEAAMLTEPPERFEQRLAAQYADWQQFSAWRRERREAA